MLERTTSNTRKVGLTSLIDMVFLLLVFFMLTTTFQRNQATEINFGQATKVEAIGDVETVIVTARAGGLIGLGTDAYPPREFATALFEALDSPHADTRVIIQTTPDATVQHLVHAMDAVQTVGGATLTVVQGMVPGTEIHHNEATPNAY